MAAVCNPREVLMVLGESISCVSTAVKAKPLLSALIAGIQERAMRWSILTLLLPTVLDRLPLESRSKFLSTACAAVSGLTMRRATEQRHHSGEEEEDELDDDHDEDDDVDKKGKDNSGA